MRRFEREIRDLSQPAILIAPQSELLEPNTRSSTRRGPRHRIFRLQQRRRSACTNDGERLSGRPARTLRGGASTPVSTLRAP